MERAKPDIETFFGVPIKVFCGACGRIMFLIHKTGELEALRKGDIQFFQYCDKHLGFSRGFGGRTLRVYCNRSGDPWDIPAGRVVFGYNLQTVAPDWLTLAPRGFCVTEE